MQTKRSSRTCVIFHAFHTAFQLEMGLLLRASRRSRLKPARCQIAKKNFPGYKYLHSGELVTTKPIPPSPHSRARAHCEQNQLKKVQQSQFSTSPLIYLSQFSTLCLLISFQNALLSYLSLVRLAQSSQFSALPTINKFSQLLPPQNQFSTLIKNKISKGYLARDLRQKMVFLWHIVSWSQELCTAPAEQVHSEFTNREGALSNRVLL